MSAEQSQYSVLYVDDENDLLEIGKHFLERNPSIHVTTENSAAMALKRIESNGFDLVVSDYQMPEMNGIDLLRKIRSSGNSIPFILFTGRGREEVVIEALNSGATFYLQKGGDIKAQFTELEFKVKEAVNRQRAEERSRILSSRLEAAFGGLGDAIAIYDDKGNLVQFNEVFLRYHRLPPQSDVQALATDYSSLFAIQYLDGSDVPAELDPVHRSLRGETNSHVEFRITKKDSGESWLGSYSFTPIRDGHGEITGSVVAAHDITERKLFEGRFRLLHDTMLQGVVFQDAEGKIISMNPFAESILGKGPEEFIGSSSVDEEHLTIHEDGTPYPGREHPAMMALRTGKEVKGAVMGYYRQWEKAYRWISITAVPLFRPGEPRPYQVYTTFEDITEKKRTEEAMRKNEDLLRGVISNFPTVLWTIDAKGIFTLSEGRGLGAIGLKPGQAVGRSAFEMYRDFPVIIEGMNKALAGEASSWQVNIGDASFQTFAVPMRDKYGNITGMIGESIDITEKIMAERAIIRSEEKYRELIENIPTPIALCHYTFGDNGDAISLKVVDINNAGLISLGNRPREEVIGSDALALLGLADRSKGESAVRNIRVNGQPRSFDYHLVHTGQYFLLTVVPLDDLHVLILSTDVSELKQIENALLESQERFTQVAEVFGAFFWEVDAKGMYTYCSPAVFDILGYHPEELVGKMYFFDLFLPEQREMLKASAISLFDREEKIQWMVNENRRKDGRKVILETSGLPIVDG